MFGEPGLLKFQRLQVTLPAIDVIVLAGQGFVSGGNLIFDRCV